VTRAAPLAAAILAIALPAAAAKPPGQKALPAGRFYVKNNTLETIACTLKVDTTSQPLSLQPKEQFSATIGSRAERISLTCPTVRATAFEPLRPGTHYAFLKVRGRPDLVEVEPNGP
jgi:hypothetical protein